MIFCTVLPVMLIRFGLVAVPPLNPQVMPVIVLVVAAEARVMVLFLIFPHTPLPMLIPVTVLVEAVPPLMVLLSTDRPR